MWSCKALGREDGHEVAISLDLNSSAIHYQWVGLRASGGEVTTKRMELSRVVVFEIVG